MENLKKIITKNLQNHERVLIFTQNRFLIKDFLIDEPGKWNIQYGSRWWGDFLKKQEKVIEGKTLTGFKIGINQYTKEPIISDVHGRFTFTKDIFYPLNGEFIIKDWLEFPEVVIEKQLPPIVAIQKYKSVCIIPDNIYNYHALHDQLSIQDISHSLDDSGEKKLIHIMKYPRFIEEGYETAIIYGSKDISYLLPFHNFKRIILVRPDNFTSNFNFRLMRAIDQCFAEAPHCALSPEYISYKTFSNPKTIEQNMLLMEMAGFLKRCRLDNQTVIIQKRGEMPKELEFHAIPDGEHSISKIANYLKIPREEVFPLLKKYEGKGLIFSYNSQSQPKIWQWVQHPDEGFMKDFLSFFYEDQILLDNIVRTGEVALNQYLEKRIQTHSLSNQVSAMCLDIQGKITNIDPTSKNLVDLELHS